MKIENYKRFVHPLYESEFEPIKEEYKKCCNEIQNDTIIYPELKNSKSL